MSEKEKYAQTIMFEVGKPNTAYAKYFIGNSYLAPDSWFSHLAIEIEGTETSNEWLEPVTDEEYNKLS